MNLKLHIKTPANANQNNKRSKEYFYFTAYLFFKYLYNFLSIFLYLNNEYVFKCRHFRYKLSDIRFQ